VIYESRILLILP